MSSVAGQRFILHPTPTYPLKLARKWDQGGVEFGVSGRVGWSAWGADTPGILPPPPPPPLHPRHWSETYRAAPVLAWPPAGLLAGIGLAPQAPIADTLPIRIDASNLARHQHSLAHLKPHFIVFLPLGMCRTIHFCTVGLPNLQRFIRFACACPSNRLSHQVHQCRQSQLPLCSSLPAAPTWTRPISSCLPVPSPSRLPRHKLRPSFELLAGGSVAAILLLCVANSAESRQLERHTAAARGAALRPITLFQWGIDLPIISCPYLRRPIQTWNLSQASQAALV